MAKKAEKMITVVMAGALVYEGEIITKGKKLTIPEKFAKNWLRRGKCTLADQQPEPDEVADLDAMTVAELRQVADDIGLTGVSDLKKADLIAAIEAATEPADDAE